MTFIEDSLRILTQWSDQLVYLRDFRGSKLPQISKHTVWLGLQTRAESPPFSHPFATQQWLIEAFFLAAYSSLGDHTSLPNR